MCGGEKGNGDVMRPKSGVSTLGERRCRLLLLALEGVPACERTPAGRCFCTRHHMPASSSQLSFGQKLHTTDLREKVTVSLTMLSHGRPVGQSCETRSSREPHHRRRGKRRANCASGSPCLRLDESSSKVSAPVPEINLSADSVVGVLVFICKQLQT